MIRRMYERLRYRLAREQHATIRGLRAELEASRDRVLAVLRERDEARAEVARLTPAPGPMDEHLTEYEMLSLDILRCEPGMLALEYGGLLWHRLPRMPCDRDRTEPGHWDRVNGSRHFASLVRKGHARREKAGQSDRYWPVDK